MAYGGWGQRGEALCLSQPHTQGGKGALGLRRQARFHAEPSVQPALPRPASTVTPSCPRGGQGQGLALSAGTSRGMVWNVPGKVKEVLMVRRSLGLVVLVPPRVRLLSVKFCQNSYVKVKARHKQGACAYVVRVLWFVRFPCLRLCSDRCG